MTPALIAYWLVCVALAVVVQLGQGRPLWLVQIRGLAFGSAIAALTVLGASLWSPV